MIENNPISSLSTTPADQLKPAEKKAHSIEQQSLEKGRDKVVLSNEAKLLSKATTALNDSPDLKSDKVERVTQQVQDGTYQVPVSKLASVLLERLYKTE
jgi:flagellar biosynthesis anti-sigma factor FlgM